MAKKMSKDNKELILGAFFTLATVLYLKKEAKKLLAV